MIQRTRPPLSLLFSIVLGLGPGAPAVVGQDPSVQGAFAAAMRGEAATAVQRFVALAHAAAAGVDDGAALAAETFARLALEHDGRAPAPARADGDPVPALLALRGSALGAARPDVADQIAVACLERKLRRGDADAPALARALGFVDTVWIAGPFENERGAAFARTGPAEQGFDPDQTWPGKQRQVAWRRVADLGPTGPLWLGAVLRPAQQVAGTVAVSLVAEAPTRVALHVGSSGSVTVHLGRAKVFARDVDRQFAFDQDVVALPLQQGPNLLLVEFCHQERGAFAASLRLAAPGGGPAGGVAIATSRDDLLAAETAAAARANGDVATAAPDGPDAPDGPEARHGARSTTSAATASGLDALWLSMLLHHARADAEADRRDRALAQRAAQALPTFAPARLHLAATLQRAALVAAELDDNEQRAILQQVLREDAQNVEALVRLGRLEAAGTGLFASAEALARRALAIAPDCADARLLLADALQGRGLEPLAQRERLRAAESAAAPSPALRAAAQTLLEIDRPRAAFAMQRRLIDGSGDVDDWIATISSARRLGDREAAGRLLTQAERLHPTSRGLHVLRARLAEEDGDRAAALQWHARWLALCPDDDDAMVETSRLAALLGDRERQLELLREAIECNPNRRDEPRYVEFLAAETTPFHAAWQRDVEPLLAVPTPEAALAAKDPLFTLLDQRVVRTFRNGTTSQYRHFAMRVLTEQGARELSTYRLPVYRGEQRGRLLRCVVHTADGQRQEPRLRGAAVALPSLRPGDVVEIEGRVDDLAPTFFGDYFGLEHRFTATHGGPVHRAELVVVADPGRDYRWQVDNGAPEPRTSTREDGTLVYEFAIDDLPRDTIEVRRPDRDERDPIARFSTFADWNAFARWWWNLIRGQIETTPAMRAKVAELTRDCATQEERIAAIYRFVTTDVRYEAWEFGVHGYKPYSTAVIFERRHGDCKDKALLLSALLREIGVTAAPVLIHADPLRSRDDLTLPMVEHFNHCIAFLPEQADMPARFVDGTAVWHPIDTLPAMDQGADVLVVDGNGGGALRRVPWAGPEQNRTQIEHVVELRENAVRVEQTQRPTGTAAVDLRAAFAGEPARRRELVERMLVPTFGPVTIESLECSDALDLDEPVAMTVRFTTAALGQRSGTQWQLPSVFGDDPLLSTAPADQRTTPLLLGAPTEDRRRIRYRLPPGLLPRELPAPARRQETFGSFEVTWRVDGDAVVVDRTVVRRAVRIEPGDYAAWRDFLSALRQADARRIVLEPQGGGR